MSLVAKVCPGDDKMSTFGLWNELQIVKNLLKALDNQGMVWKVRGDENELSVQEEVENLLEMVKQEGPRRVRTNVKKEENKPGQYL